jgi:Skp family chaperone for outer membrane proteins
MSWHNTDVSGTGKHAEKATMIRFLPIALICWLPVSTVCLAAEPLPIALVNVDRICKTYQPFLKRLEPLKEAAKEVDQSIQVRQAELETAAVQFRNAPPGSPESQRLQMQVIKLQNELQQFINSERQKLQQKEAGVFLAFHKELDVQISKYAKEHGIKLVVRQFETSLEGGEDRPLPEIIQILNRTILYEEGLNITDEILKALAARSTGASER